MSTSVEDLLDDYRERIKDLDILSNEHPGARLEGDGEQSWFVDDDLSLQDCDSLLVDRRAGEMHLLPAKRVRRWSVVPGSVFSVSVEILAYRITGSKVASAVIAELWKKP